MEALCVHRIFAAAGVPMEDVYVIPKNCVDPDTLVVQARRGGITFTVTVGPVGMPPDEFATRWPEAVRAYRRLTREEAVALTDRAAIRGRAVDIVAGMVLKGFPRRDFLGIQTEKL